MRQQPVKAHWLRRMGARTCADMDRFARDHDGADVLQMRVEDWEPASVVFMAIMVFTEDERVRFITETLRLRCEMLGLPVSYPEVAAFLADDASGHDARLARAIMADWPSLPEVPRCFRAYRSALYWGKHYKRDAQGELVSWIDGVRRERLAAAP